MGRYYSRITLHRRVVVNLTDGSAILGVLWEEHGKGPDKIIVIRDASLVDPNIPADRPAQLDGEVLIPASRIRFVQTPEVPS